MKRILNFHLAAAIKFHDKIHRFLAGRGTRTAYLKAKLIQYIMMIREEVLYEMFLYLHKPYGALERDRCLDILVVYEVGPLTIRLLRRYWDQLTLVARAGGYYGALFKGFRGVTHREPLSPTIFNVVVDSVLYHWITVVDPSEDPPPPPWSV